MTDHKKPNIEMEEIGLTAKPDPNIEFEAIGVDEWGRPFSEERIISETDKPAEEPPKEPIEFQEEPEEPIEFLDEEEEFEESEDTESPIHVDTLAGFLGMESVLNEEFEKNKKKNKED